MRNPSIQRMAVNLGPIGERLLEVLNDRAYTVKMEDAVRTAMPPLSHISVHLKQDFPEVDFGSLRIRQFIGCAVREAMQDMGYVVEDSGVRIPRDPIFKSGSTYRKAISGEAEDILLRIVSILTPMELKRLRAILK